MFLPSVALLLNNSVILPGQENIFPRDQTSHLLCPGHFLNRKCMRDSSLLFSPPHLWNYEVQHVLDIEGDIPFDPQLPTARILILSIWYELRYLTSFNFIDWKSETDWRE